MGGGGGGVLSHKYYPEYWGVGGGGEVRMEWRVDVAEELVYRLVLLLLVKLINQSSH